MFVNVIPILIITVNTLNQNFATHALPFENVSSDHEISTDPITEPSITETTTTGTTLIADETTTTATTTSTTAAAVHEAGLEVAEAKKKLDSSLLSVSAPAGVEPVTNDVTEKNFEELEFLCHHYYKDEFVVSAHVMESGCLLECVFLRSSGQHGGGFFDTSVKKHHNINEGQSCDGANVSNTHFLFSTGCVS